jgi:DNA-directed RNA polymerase specialized sigma24 family protein
VRTYPSWKAVNPDKSVLDWVRIVTANAKRDHLRARLGPRPVAAQPSVKRLLNEFASSEGLDERGHRPPFTAAETARELYEFARRHLPALQFAVLTRWLEEQSFEEIAKALDIEADQSARLLHAGIAALRRRFREKADGAVSR